MNKKTDEKVSSIMEDNGAFWAFSTKRFNEQKKEGVKYASLGAGLLCPVNNAKTLIKELSEAIKQGKKEEKAKREARAKALKIKKLPKSERIKNRKILIAEAISRINNFMDDSFVAEHYRMIDNAKPEKIDEVIDSLLSTIDWRYHGRADYEPEVKEVYDENIKIIKELREEIKDIVS